MDELGGMLFSAMPFVTLYPLVPRFILGLRALYARDLRGRRGGEIDTAFGLNSVSDRGTLASTIMFADAGRNGGEEVQMEDRESSGDDSSA